LRPGEYVSGEELSERLGFSRANTWKYIKKLINDGYKIDAAPKKGYKLISSPDKFFGYDVSGSLSTNVIGKNNVYYYDILESTNDKAYQLAESGAGEGDVILAEQQTRGKGRMGREWVSPPGVGLYFSIILRPAAPITRLPSVTLMASASIVKVLRDIYNINAGIKWPNDIYMGDKKIAGILTQIKAQQDMVDFVILGAGINVNTLKADLPSLGTSLRECADKLFERKEVLKYVIEMIDKDYSDYVNRGFIPELEDIKKYSLILGRRVSVEVYDKTINGEAVDIDVTGALIVKTGDEMRKVFSGDVMLCREG
jgi:BirA family biotin operon repressor/biotin-[acetyl-CoA-carboxylase] ligase